MFSSKCDFIVEDFSLSSKLQDKDGNVVYKDGEALIHTDGTGFISEDLALKCPTYVYKEKCTNDDSTEVCLLCLICFKLCI